jgi:hypothetical protein
MRSVKQRSSGRCRALSKRPLEAAPARQELIRNMARSSGLHSTISGGAHVFGNSFAFVLDPLPPELFDLARAEFGGDAD